MAAPTVRARTAPAAGLSATSPGGTAVGDAVIVFSWEQAGAGVPTHTLQSGFVELFSQPHDDGSFDGRLSVAYKIATGSGATSYQAYTSSSGTTVRTGIIVLTVGTHSLGTTQKGAAAGAGFTNTGTTVINPPSVTLGTSRDWLVIAFAGWHMSAAADNTVTVPTNYSNLQQVAGSSASDVASAERERLALASEDPGTFGDSVTPNGSSAVTVGIPNPVERTAAVGATGAVTVANREFLSILERSAGVGATAAIASAGEFESPAAPSHERAAAIAATGAIASAGTFLSVFSRSAAVGATASVASAGHSIVSASVAIGATASIASAPQRVLSRSSAISATATIASSGTFFSILSRSAALAATGAIATGRLVVAQRSASLTATAGLSVAGEIAGAVTRSVALNAVASVSASGRNATASRSVSVAASASLTVAGSVVPELERSVALTAVGLVAVAGVVVGTEVVEFPVSRAPVLTSATAGRLVPVELPDLEAGSSSVPILASAGYGRILSPDVPRLEDV